MEWELSPRIPGTWLIPLAWLPLFFPNCLEMFLRSQPQLTLSEVLLLTYAPRKLLQVKAS